MSSRFLTRHTAGRAAPRRRSGPAGWPVAVIAGLKQARHCADMQVCWIAVTSLVLCWPVVCPGVANVVERQSRGLRRKRSSTVLWVAFLTTTTIALSLLGQTQAF